jgi:hypothetical protein
VRRHRPLADCLLIVVMRVENLLDPILLVARQIESPEHHRSKNAHRSARPAAPTAAEWFSGSSGAAELASTTASGRTLGTIGLARRESDACQRDGYGCGTQAEYDAFAHAVHVVLLLPLVFLCIGLAPGDNVMDGV